MSYASVAANNAPPPSSQPHADPSLLTTTNASVDNVADDAAKLNVVSSDFRENPATLTSETYIPVESEGPLSGTPPKGKETKGKQNKRLQEVEAEGEYVWQVAKHYLLRPGVAGGLVGLVNVGLLSGMGYAFYTNPHLRRDGAVLSSALAGTLVVLSTEGYAAERYRQTPRGREEERRAREEGSLIYKHAREIVLRPGVLGGLVGFVNTAVLGTVGYYSYINWDRRRWDPNVVSAVTVGLLTLWGGEGSVSFTGTAHKMLKFMSQISC
ncbi:hypothetical protein BV22DRAFT_1007566 [Leucogyrophana mollusca]|uniref:Uncharacterized protein n=1 Tax=Leucogyrophana mollusca TaxID=85980 RepID=A0ACB8BML0_9AGAM|nr:hypothetical protein BV22DRAFT_1007566 [Leucogyrophana mollusca]